MISGEAEYPELEHDKKCGCTSGQSCWRHGLTLPGPRRIEAASSRAAEDLTQDIVRAAQSAYRLGQAQDGFPLWQIFAAQIRIKLDTAIARAVAEKDAEIERIARNFHSLANEHARSAAAE